MNKRMNIMSENMTMNNTNTIDDEVTMKETTMNSNQNINRQVIVDLVNKIKYEVTEQQLAELAGSATPLNEAEFVDWHAKIDNLDLSKGPSWTRGEVAAQLREFLHRVLQCTRKIGGKIVAVGKRLVKFILSLLDLYPVTLAAAVIMAALCYVVASIPWLGVVLLPIAKVATVCVVGVIALGESLRNLKMVAVVVP